MYTRVVVIFVGAVVVSLFAAFAVAQVMYKSQVQNLVLENLIDNGKKMIQSYEATSSADLVPFMRNAAEISNNAIQIYDSRAQPTLPHDQSPIRADRADVRLVLAGGIARQHENEHRFPVIGLPMQVHGKPYALFIMPLTNNLFGEIGKAMRTVLIIVLVFGSVLILVASRYIVKPVLRLTEATRRMAKGQFDIAIDNKRKDEIGQLTASFNEMARELGKLDRMRQDFVSNVSHEIQTPLTSISGFTKALKQKTMNEQSRRHYLTIIEEESDRLSRLSQNLLQLSTLQQGYHAADPDTYRLDEQLRRVVIALEPQWSQKSIHMDLQCAQVTIEADEDQLRQVWTNLLGNSIKFSLPDSTIRISSVQSEDLAIVSITDEGPGIPLEERTDIFKPFHKVDKSRDRSVNGSGLGLSIVKQIVDLHQGEIEVSGEPGEGSTFTVRVPLQDRKA